MPSTEDWIWASRKAVFQRASFSARLRLVMSWIWATKWRGAPSESRTRETFNCTQTTWPSLWR